jgi:outer membrane protein assembly factor BamE (lipoprotein component of BamABCDE complex)
MRNLLIAFLAASIICGCASYGNNFDEKKVSQIRKGETTEADLISLFGAPTGRCVNSESGAVLTWTYAESRTKGETFIPIAGAFVGGATTSSKTLIVRLDQSGKVLDYSYSSGNTGSSGMPQPVPGASTNAPAYSPKAGSS